MIRIYRSPMPKKSGAAATSSESRSIKPFTRRSAPPVSAQAPSTTTPVSETNEETVENPSTTNVPIVSLSTPNKVFNRLSRRPSPTNRSKSPTKPSNKQPKNVDASPKRQISSDNVNVERLKLARDEAERAIRVNRKLTLNVLHSH